MIDAKKVAAEILRMLEEEGGRVVFPLAVMCQYDRLRGVYWELEKLGCVDTFASTWNLGKVPVDSPHSFTSICIEPIDDEFFEQTLAEDTDIQYLFNVNEETGDVRMRRWSNAFNHMPVPEHTLRRKFLFLPDRHLVYGVVNKVANTYIHQALTGCKDIEEANAKGFSAVGHIPYIVSRLSDLYKFTVVRNPYTRLASFYFDNLRGHEYFPRPYEPPLAEVEASVYRRSLGLPISGKIPFADLVEAIELKGFVWGPRFEHWLPQAVVSCYGTVGYGSVGRLEELVPYLRRNIEPILRDNGDTRKVIFPDAPVRSSGNASKYLDLYDADTYRRVYNLYKIDFELFGYRLRSHWR